jgi:hypothetical protein
MGITSLFILPRGSMKLNQDQFSLYIMGLFDKFKKDTSRDKSQDIFTQDEKDEAFKKFLEKNRGKESELAEIMGELKENFTPEPIRDEYDLESQIKIFLQVKFPNKTIKRKQRTENNNEVDILIDELYCLELKVPESRTHLRNLGAQADEYQEEYEIGIIIYQDESLNLSENIQDYVKKYKTKYGIDTIVYSGKIRK